MEITQIERAIGFDKILEKKEIENLQNLFKLTSEFGNIYKKEKARLPYHINVIDELHADENSHSRIFAKLLSYQENNKYPFLENFLNEICNFNIFIENPIIKKVDSCGRIDIPIFDNQYVVLIENKVTDKANDQNRSNGGQLARYIETIKTSYGRNIEEIYVVYTPKYTRKPSDESWINKDNFSYKNDFKLRFSTVSYRDDIYPWLKNTIISSIEKKNNYMYCAIEQYIDHLEGMFNLRAINKPMNMKLQEFLKEELKIKEGNLEEAIKLLSEKETELLNAMGQIQLMKSEFNKQVVINNFDQYKKLLHTDFPNLEVVGDRFKLFNSIINVGVKFTLDDKEFDAILECNDCDEPTLYFGISRRFVSPKKYEVPETLQKIINDNKLSHPEDFWYGWKYTSSENAYLDLQILINQILPFVKIMPERITVS